MIFSFVVRVDRTLLSSPSRSCYTSGQIYSRIYERSQPWQTLDAYETVHCSGSGIHPLLWDHLCMHTGYEFLVFSSIPTVLHRAFFHNHAFLHYDPRRWTLHTSGHTQPFLWRLPHTHSLESYHPLQERDKGTFSACYRCGFGTPPKTVHHIQRK